ncbi:MULTISPECIES: hypothetical protein [unclassified Nostoc]|uniref:hypothetical protein n=1 Tax=unclassified Nostoc TaxID=2593658 RepID=UPI0025AA8CAE|nr:MULTISPECIES: hypothetical protein [unclassified Nostoc]MDM9584830.1 hypothetical protein [Nostoc sp. GT001]MDZ7948494.1 hypothetical protein [Nostoc sp. EfeVER01]MDZ7991808.1 hypothetical protein [Nostoc sp. EspVER01]
MFKSVIVSSLLIATAGLNILPCMTATAQDPPANTYKAGVWQPVARLNIKSPITILIINKAGFSIDYGITDAKVKRPLIKAKQQVTLQNLQYPLQLVIYPDYNIAGSANYFLQYAVKLKDQVVEVTVEEADNANKSHRALDIQETGAVYLY